MTDNIFEENIVPLIDEDGNEVKFEIIADAEYEGAMYFALIPADDEEVEEYFILKAVTSEEVDDELVDLIEIEDDEEFAKVADIFDEMFDA